MKQEHVAPRIRLIRWAIAAIAALLATDARALCTVTCSCAVSTTNVVFGAINPLSLSNTDSVGGVTVSCGGIAGLLIPLQVDIGKGSSGNYAARTLVSGTNTLSYNLYQDSARSMVFGNATNGTVDASSSMLLSALGIGTPVTIPIYGRVFGAQVTAVPGSYADTISVTLTYY
jgi:spore coat protein U-like protein